MIETSKNLFKKERLTDFIAIVSVLASLSAGAYLYGFGLAAKINILAYVTFSDYLRVAIGWIAPSLILPFLVGYFLPSATATFFSDRAPKRGSDHQEPDDQHVPNWIFKLTLATFVSCIILLIISIWFYDIKLIFTFIKMTIIIFWIGCIAWYFKSDENIVRIGFQNARLLLLIPSLLIYSLGSGLSHGAVGTKFIRNSGDVVAVSTENGGPIFGELLFTFDRFLVVRETGRHELTLLSSDKIVAIKTPISAPSSSSGAPPSRTDSHTSGETK